jgi:hypothetical protein
VLLGPIVQPWYLMWGIAVLAVTAGPGTASAIAVLSVSISLLGVVGLGQLTGEFASLGLPYQVLFILVLATSIVIPIRPIPLHQISPTTNDYSSRGSLARVWSVLGV